MTEFLKKEVVIKALDVYIDLFDAEKETGATMAEIIKAGKEKIKGERK